MSFLSKKLALLFNNMTIVPNGDAFLLHIGDVLIHFDRYTDTAVSDNDDGIIILKLRMSCTIELHGNKASQFRAALISVVLS